MTVADRIIDLVKRAFDLTEAELAQKLFGKEGYQQRVNSTCRRLVSRGVLIRTGHGGPSDPFKYRLA